MPAGPRLAQSRGRPAKKTPFGKEIAAGSTATFIREAIRFWPVTYFSELCEIVRSIPEQTLDLTAPRTRAKTPSQAFSDFTIHREQGYWAERMLAAGLNDSIGSGYDIVKYGKSDTIIAGQEGFKEFYEQYQDELESVGKKPDVLVFEKNVVDGTDISMMGVQEHAGVVGNAVIGIEIRSSSFLAEKYRQKNKNDPKKFMSFTVKIEDIQAVMRWVEAYNVRHYYAQVFFDEIHMISFKRILEAIRDHAGDKTVYRIEENRRNQSKTTAYINVSQGVKIGEIKTPPTPISKMTELDSGRLLYYVGFNNGAVAIDRESVLSLIRG